MERRPGSDGEPDHPASRKIRLDQFLKYIGFAATGGQAKLRIQSGEVRVNGEIETRRGRGLRPGDRIEADGQAWTVGPELWESPGGNAESRPPSAAGSTPGLQGGGSAASKPDSGGRETPGPQSGGV